MLHELFLKTKQKTKIRNAFANNMLTNIILSKAQISKIIQLGWSFGSWLSNLGKKTILNYDVPFAGDELPGLVSNTAANAASNAIHKFERE